MRTLEDYLCDNAALYAGKAAVVCHGEEITYAQLWQRVERRAEGLRRQGVGEATPYVFRASQSVEFLVTYFAVHCARGVAVPLENTLPEERYREIERLVESSNLPSGTADVLFTTGTTGKGKGVMISHEAIIADAENLIEAQRYSHELTFIINGPLNHIGSLSKVYPVILTGGTLAILDGMKDTDAFFAALDRSESKCATFLVPSSIHLLLMWSERRLQEYADKLDFIETGAAPIAQSDMEHLCRLLPNTRLYNTYASTETGIICTYDFNVSECMAGCLGKPMKHSSLFITEQGTVACQGKTLMTGYVGDPNLTSSVLRDHILFTHDNGMIDAQGRLHLIGRSDDVINVGGFKISPVEIENAAMALPEIADCVCVSVAHPIMGNLLKLLVVLEEGQHLDKRSIAQYLRSQLETFKVPLLYEAVDHIQRTYNGKIDRKFYR
ncbi:MAG: acyl--CoA ligase [Paraprevotella sp.]|nr:acyl--CoA ligase [Paraprevotella sp.]